MTGRPRRPAPAATAVLVVLALVATARAATVRTFPNDCPLAAQDCIAASAEGDVVRIATETAIAETLILNQPLTLENAPGVRPRLAPGNDVSINNFSTTVATYVVRGLTLERGSIRATQGGTMPLFVAIDDNVILDSGTGPFGAIDVTTLGGGGNLGAIDFSIRRNVVTARPTPGGGSTGIRIEPGRQANAHGVIAGNQVDFPDSESNGSPIVVRNHDRSLSVDVIGNTTLGSHYEVGVFLAQIEAGGTLSARVANNVVQGVDDESQAGGIDGDLGQGTLRVTIVHNTFVRVSGGIAFENNDPLGVLDAVVANNVIAAHGGRGLHVPTRLVSSTRFGPNLVFGVESSLLPPGTVIADPRFAAADDVRLAPGSPAIDAGAAELVPLDLTTDFAGNPRRVGGAVDLGAVEAPCPDGSFTPDVCPTTPPPTGACVTTACDDGDPCTIDDCAGDACVHVARNGIDGARCACDRSSPAACAADGFPPAVSRRTARACGLLDRAAGASRPNRLLRRAAHTWAGAAKLATRRRVAGSRTPDCRSAIATDLHDAERRASDALQSPR
ncbi:MAG TPA: choice-of-anchor Q domain-containing protein [Candidatus Binatia bacterium]|jgi:hypothetical protein|nr:choice-of-anchor Q domain-containing protein [Candidatus Binatia bacterium]